MADFKPVFGYEPNPEAAGEFVASLARPTIAEAGPLLKSSMQDTHLGHFLLKEIGRAHV